MVNDTFIFALFHYTTMSLKWQMKFPLYTLSWTDFDFLGRNRQYVLFACGLWLFFFQVSILLENDILYVQILLQNDWQDGGEAMKFGSEGQRRYNSETFDW